jgi:hypothetical protein
MADLRDREVAVSEKNDSRMGPSGRRARSADSFYLEVGGSRDTYNVTVNFDSKNGHWCETVAGKRCHGNGNGKGQKYGPPQSRDKRNPVEWCKHVQAALADTEALAEAQDRTAKAFGRVADSYKPKPEPKPEPVEPVAITQTVSSARDRLAAIEVEAAAIRADVAGRVAALVSEFGSEAVAVALRQNEAA